jgi:hypothetical protein
VTRRTRFGDFKLDLDERAVTLRDQALRLTSEEFDGPRIPGWPPTKPSYATNRVGQKFDRKSAWTNQALNNVSFSPQEAGRRRSWGALPSD